MSQTAKQAIPDESNEALISAASAWEIATRYRLGSLPAAEAFTRDSAGTVTHQGSDESAITVEDVVRAGSLSSPLRDPFDRILIAKALARSLVPNSIEECFGQNGVSRLW